MSRLNIVSILIQIMAAALIAARTCKAVSSPRTNEPSSSSLSVVDLEAGDVADAAVDGWRRRRQNLPRAFQDDLSHTTPPQFCLLPPALNNIFVPSLTDGMRTEDCFCGWGRQRDKGCEIFSSDDASLTAAQTHNNQPFHLPFL